MASDDRAIHIVGRNNLQNDLLSAHLEMAAGICCVCNAAIEDVASHPEPGSSSQLILIDCFATDKERIVSILEAGASKLAGRHAALFNLPVETSVELAALRHGVHGFFYAKDSVEALTKGVLALFQGEYWVSRKLLAEFLATPNEVPRSAIHYPGLTLRESQLMALLVRGLSNQAIADQLFISIPTVKTHLGSIYRKLSVTNRLQAVCWADKNSPTS